MRILVVDDDDATRLCLAKVLASVGEVQSVPDGAEALGALKLALDQGRPFGLVCMDICMPNLNGQEALQALRALEAQHKVPVGQEAKVIMISSCDDTGNVCEAYFHGLADGFVKKPLRLASLREELTKMGFLAP